MSYDENISKMRNWFNRFNISIIGILEGENRVREKKLIKLIMWKKFFDMNEEDLYF